MIRRGAGTGRSTGPVTASERMARWGHGGAVIETATQDDAIALERILFDRGCSAAVAGGPSAASALKAAGMLAILVTPRAPQRDAATAVRDLEQQGILVSGDTVSGGGGI